MRFIQCWHSIYVNYCWCVRNPAICATTGGTDSCIIKTTTIPCKIKRTIQCWHGHCVGCFWCVYEPTVCGTTNGTQLLHTMSVIILNNNSRTCTIHAILFDVVVAVSNDYVYYKELQQCAYMGGSDCEVTDSCCDKKHNHLKCQKLLSAICCWVPEAVLLADVGFSAHSVAQTMSL